jgi:hypothetical protein
MNPFSSEMLSLLEPGRVVGPTGMTRAGLRLLAEPWFEAERDVALTGLGHARLEGCMELRFGLHEQVSKSQLDLLNAVRKSEIHTFGWPIGVVMDNVAAYRPQPYADGIRAEISTPKGGISDRQTYDYWSARRNGDFYLLQSLFEDMHPEPSIFFNTRIVRVAEALMFAANLYSNLGASPEASFSVRVSHRGLAERKLGSAGFNRIILPRVCHESVSESEIVIGLGKSRETLVDDVRRIVEPLFMLFEFQEFGADIYTDIVRRFERGIVS